MPNNALWLTRYGRLCKPGLPHMVHHQSPALRHLPPRSAQLERYVTNHDRRIVH